jgi:hypothetical protein
VPAEGPAATNTRESESTKQKNVIGLTVIGIVFIIKSVKYNFQAYFGSQGERVAERPNLSTVMVPSA